MNKKFYYIYFQNWIFSYNAKKSQQDLKRHFIILLRQDIWYRIIIKKKGNVQFYKSVNTKYYLRRHKDSTLWLLRLWRPFCRAHIVYQSERRASVMISSITSVQISILLHLALTCNQTMKSAHRMHCEWNAILSAGCGLAHVVIRSLSQLCWKCHPTLSWALHTLVNNE